MRPPGPIRGEDGAERDASQKKKKQRKLKESHNRRLTSAGSPQVGGLDIKPHLSKGGTIVAQVLDGLTGLGSWVLAEVQEDVHVPADTPRRSATLNTEARAHTPEA